MRKLYHVTLFDTEDGGYLQGEAFFEHAKEAREEFLRIKKLINNGYEAYENFTHYYNSDWHLKLSVVYTGGRITYFDNDPSSKREIPSPRKQLNHIDYVFKRVVSGCSRATYKTAYDEINYRTHLINVEHTIAKGKRVAIYTIQLVGYDRVVYVYVDFGKKKFVISGQPWHGYIMPEKK